MTVFELIQELSKIPNKNLPVRADVNTEEISDMYDYIMPLVVGVDARYAECMLKTDAD